MPVTYPNARHIPDSIREAAFRGDLGRSHGASVDGRICVEGRLLTVFGWQLAAVESGPQVKPTLVFYSSLKNYFNLKIPMQVPKFPLNCFKGSFLNSLVRVPFQAPFLKFV